MTIRISFKKIRPDAIVPKYQTKGASGLDISYCGDKSIVLKPFTPLLVPTGLTVEIPNGYEGQVRPRSSLGLKGITIPNSPGTIDSDYRGELKIIMMNLNRKVIEIEPGQRVAQLAITKVEKARVTEKRKLSRTKRGHGGFGSTGR